MEKIITFLGTGNYQETIYEGVDRDGKNIQVETRFVQKAICKLIGQDAILYVGLTDKARTENWLSGIKKVKDFKTCEIKEEYRVGLKEILDNENIMYKEFFLYDGKNEKEMWQNFDSIFNILDEGNEIYVDVTHSFRSIPFIIMSVLNYAKFIKNINIKGIYYGAFDAKTEDGIAPIFDLSLFNQLTDWAVGAENFLDTGDSKKISNIIGHTVNPILKRTRGKHESGQAINRISKNLKDFSGGLYTARGNKVSDYGIRLKKSLELIKDFNIDELKPFEKILDKIYEKAVPYSKDIVKDVHHTVLICKDFKLVQQAYTLLSENILTYLCVKAEIDYLSLKNREMVKKILLSKHNHHSKKGTLNDDKIKIKQEIDDYVNRDLARLYDDLSINFRNDINHSGFREDAKEYKVFSDRLDGFIQEFEELVFTNE